MVKLSRAYALGFGTLAALAGACSAGSSDGGSGGSTNTGGAGGNGGAGTTETVTQASTTGGFETSTVTGQMGCDAGPDEDLDGDGFSISAGDCNDCDVNVSPNALEVIGEDGQGGGGGMMEPVDEDCDGEIDNVPEPLCDSGIPMTSSDPLDAARSIELCKIAADADDWGVISAQFTRANGTPTTLSDQFGVHSSWGTNVPTRAGENMYVLSSGKARLPGAGGCGDTQQFNPWWCTGTGLGSAPTGFPQDNPSCPPSTEINDDVALDVTIKSPSNAKGYTFDFNFYSFEYPEYLCTQWNDQFIALVNPAPMGALNGNVSFDTDSNPVSVNFGYFEVCSGCPQGDAGLVGTGFDTYNDAGATGWLQTTVPVEGNQTFTIRFAIWDTGDDNFDSTVLVDNFKWIATGGTPLIGTQPPE